MDLKYETNNNNDEENESNSFTYRTLSFDTIFENLKTHIYEYFDGNEFKHIYTASSILESSSDEEENFTPRSKSSESITSTEEFVLLDERIKKSSSTSNITSRKYDFDNNRETVSLTNISDDLKEVYEQIENIYEFNDRYNPQLINLNSTTNAHCFQIDDSKKNTKSDLMKVNVLKTTPDETKTIEKTESLINYSNDFYYAMANEALDPNNIPFWCPKQENDLQQQTPNSFHIMFPFSSEIDTTSLQTYKKKYTNILFCALILLFILSISYAFATILSLIY